MSRRYAGAVPRVSRTSAVVAALLVVVVAGVIYVLTWRTHGSPPPSATSEQIVHFQLLVADVRAGYREIARVSPSEGCSSPAFDQAGVKRVVGHDVVGCALVKLGRKNGDDVELVYLRLYRYEDEGHASDHIAQLRGDYLRVAATNMAPGSRHDLPVSALGEEAPPGVTFATQMPGDGSASAIAYWWRRGTVVAVIAAGGTLGDFGPGEALALAHRIDDRAAA
jgi:hypothetical protein